MNGGASGGREVAVIALVLLLLLASMIASYSGISHGGWVNVFQFLKEPWRFSADIYLANSDLVRSSLMFAVLKATGLDFTNDFVGLAAHILLYGTASAFFYLFVRRLAPDQSAAAAAILVLLAVFYDNKVDSVRAGLIVNSTLSPTWVGQALIPVLLYLLVARRIAAAAVIATLMIAVAVKVSWLPLLLAVAHTATTPERGARWSALWFLLPFGYVAWQALQSVGGAGSNPGDLKTLTEFVLIRDMEEVTLTLQPPVALLFLVLSVPIHLWMCSRMKSAHHRNLCLWLLAVSFAAVAWNEFYIFAGYRIYPQPIFIMLQPVRALHVYILVFLTLFALEILRTERLAWHEKVAALLAIALFRVDPVGLAVMPPELQALIVVLLGIVLPRAAAHLVGRPLDQWPAVGPAYRRAGRMGIAVGVALLLTVIVAKHVVESPTVRSFNARGFADGHRWTLRYVGSDQSWSALKALAVQAADFPLLVLHRSGGEWNVALQANEIAMKGQFLGEISHFNLDLGKYRQGLERVAIVESLLQDLNAGTPMPADLAARIHARQGRLLVPDEALPMIRGAVERRFDGWALVAP